LSISQIARDIDLLFDFGDANPGSCAMRAQNRFSSRREGGRARNRVRAGNHARDPLDPF